MKPERARAPVVHRRCMRARRAAALAAAVVLAGCAMTPPALESDAAATAEPVTVAPGAPASAPDTAATLGVQVEIEAQAELKALLERHLDIVRLGRIARDEVDEAEWARLIDATPAQARELLQTEGYFSPQVTLERRPRRASGEPDVVRLAIAPGARARVVRVRLEFEGDLERGALAGEHYAALVRGQMIAGWALREGSEFGNASWSDAKAAALARLRAAGYATAWWTGTAAQVDPRRNEVRLFLAVDSGPLFRLGSLQIDGLDAQDAETVRHLVVAHQGAPVTEALLLDFQERLQKSGLFAGIDVSLDTDPAHADAARLLVRLREAPLQVYTFGVGVSANTGPRASVEHVYRRVFGYALTSHNKVELGQTRRAWDGEISTHPGEDLYRNLVGAAVEWLEGDADVVLSQRLRIGRTQDGTRIERLYFVEAERARRTTATTSTNALALSLNYHGVWRDLDSIVLPTRGFSLSGQIGGGPSRATRAETGLFTRAYARLTGYLPLGQSWYGTGRIEAGRVFLQPGVVPPDSQRWRAGGDDSVRGYGYRTLGPVTDGVVGSGNMIATASVELARPISPALPSLWGAVFVDAGNAADRLSELDPALGFGVGVRWRSPVGPLRLDWAYGREVRRWRLHFSVGIAF